MGRETIYRSVSLSDLSSAGIQLEVVADCCGTLKITSGTRSGSRFDICELTQMLHTLGLRKDRMTEVMPKSMHKKFDSTLADDYRIVGEERTDKVWLNSGYASDEAKMSTSKMKDMASQVSRLQNGGD